MSSRVIPRRVLMTADAVGGVWTYALDLSRALANEGVEVMIATMGPRPSDDQRNVARAIAGVTLVESDFALEWMDDPWRDVERAGEWLLDLEEVFEPDVVHLNGYVHGALPFRAPAVVVAHSCVFSWFAGCRTELPPPEWDSYARNVRRGLRSADRVVGISRAMLDAIVEHYGSLPSTQVIHNGRDAFHCDAQKEPLVFAAGRVWDEAKNLALLDRIDVPWQVRVAGDAPHPSPRRLGKLPADVVRQWMARASIYAFPALYEPFGLSVLEAAHAGCALVLGDIPSLREIWGDAAEYVQPRDERALERAIRALVEEPVRREELAERARARASRYSMRRMARAYLDCYSDIGVSRSVRPRKCAS